MPTKTRRSGGRRMWQHEAIDGTSFVTNLREEYCKQKPVLVLDLSPKSLRELEHTIAELLIRNRVVYAVTQRWELITAQKVLTALGALPATKKHHARG